METEERSAVARAWGKEVTGSDRLMRLVSSRHSSDKWDF